MDETDRPTARRVLMRGVSPGWVIAKVRTYEELSRPGSERVPLAVRGTGEGGWVQLDVDPGLLQYHFHNLGMWMVGLSDDDVVPDQVILQSLGPSPFDYWLVPVDWRNLSPLPGKEDVHPAAYSSVLHGRRGDGSPYTYELAGGVERTEPQLYAPAVPARVALLDRGVPPSLIDDWQAMPVMERTEMTPWLLDWEPETLFGRLFKGLFSLLFKS